MKRLSTLLSYDPGRRPGFALSALPIIFLLTFLVGILVVKGAGAISDTSHYVLLVAGILALVLAAFSHCLGKRGFLVGLTRSARQILPAVPMLIFIATVSTTWMLSGVVPVLIDFGVRVIDPTFFLVTTCVVCSLISVLTGSSWSTIATIGVAFMGIGSVMGYSAGWIAGAIISGAYFGDKVSPLSDTTVVASSACGVDLFKHIRYLMLTAIPSMGLALVVFLLAGIFSGSESAVPSGEMSQHLASVFNLNPWVLVIPAVTVGLIVMRVPTIITLAAGSLMGTIGVFVFQPQIIEMIAGGVPADFGEYASLTAGFLWGETAFNTGFDLLDSLITTGGITGMLTTVALVLCAMFFGTAMIGTGMLSTITNTITRKLRRRFSVVSATVASGLFLNACTADQYLSIIIGGNMYRDAYRRTGMEARLLSRTLEDSVSVTSVLIPWNSCGVTQSAVLGVNTLAYLPYCVFNYLSPLMSLLMAFTGFKIKQAVTSSSQKTARENTPTVMAETA